MVVSICFNTNDAIAVDKTAAHNSTLGIVLLC